MIGIAAHHPSHALRLIRGIGVLLAVFGLAAALSACDQQTSSGDGTSAETDQGGGDEPYQTATGRDATETGLGAVVEDPPTVALVMKTLTNPFFVEVERGARRAEEELGIDLVVRTAAQETSIEQQIAIVDELVHAEVDAIVIAPGDSIRLIPVLQQAHEAGVVVVNIDNRLDPDFMSEHGMSEVPFISVDNERSAYQSARYIAENARLPAEAAIIEGIRDADNAQARLRGAERAFAEWPEIEVVASETANWMIDEGYEVMGAVLADHPNVSLVFAANDMMALGAIQYIREAGLTDEVAVASYDALEEAIQAVQEGTLAATVDQQAALQGYLGVEQAVRLMNGEGVPAETMIDAYLVTSDTLDAMR